MFPLKFQRGWVSDAQGAGFSPAIMIAYAQAASSQNQFQPDRGTKKNSLKIANNTFSDFIKKYGPDKNFPILGIETSGKPEIFGTVDEVISLAKAIPEIEPILNVPHAHALNGGNLIEGKDFKSILDKFQPYAKGDLYLEYAGVEYDDTGEKKLTAIKHGV